MKLALWSVATRSPQRSMSSVRLLPRRGLSQISFQTLCTDWYAKYDCARYLLSDLCVSLRPLRQKIRTLSLTQRAQRSPRRPSESPLDIREESTFVETKRPGCFIDRFHCFDLFARQRAALFEPPRRDQHACFE